jgi:hypothetical protein
MQIATGHWKCDGVRFRFDRMFRAAEPAQAVVEVAASRISWQRCTLDLGEPPRRRTGEEAAAVGVHWRSTEGATELPMTMEQCTFHGVGAMFQFDLSAKHDRDGGIRQPRHAALSCENVLHLGGGPLLSWNSDTSQNRLSLALRHVTQRNAGPLVQCHSDDPASLPTIAVSADDCVLEPRRGRPVFEYVAAIEPALNPEAFAWSGEGSLLAPNAPLIAWTDSTTGTMQELDSDSVALDGLAVGQVRFAGLPTTSAADSVVTFAETPRRSPEPPGIVAGLFGACP